MKFAHALVILGFFSLSPFSYADHKNADFTEYKIWLNTVAPIYRGQAEGCSDDCSRAVYIGRLSSGEPCSLAIVNDRMGSSISLYRLKDFKGFGQRGNPASSEDDQGFDFWAGVTADKFADVPGGLRWDGKGWWIDSFEFSHKGAIRIGASLKGQWGTPQEITVQLGEGDTPTSASWKFIKSKETISCDDLGRVPSYLSKTRFGRGGI